MDAAVAVEKGQDCFRSFEKYLIADERQDGAESMRTDLELEEKALAAGSSWELGSRRGLVKPWRASPAVADWRGR